MAGESGYEAMGGKKSPRAGRQGMYSRAAEEKIGCAKTLRCLTTWLRTKKRKSLAKVGGDVRYNSNRGKTY